MSMIRLAYYSHVVVNSPRCPWLVWATAAAVHLKQPLRHISAETLIGRSVSTSMLSIDSRDVKYFY